MIQPKAVDRTAKYTSKLVPSIFGARFTANRDTMISNFTGVTQELVDIEDRTRAILDGVGTIQTHEYARYFAYSKQLWKIPSEGAAANLAAQNIHDKWESRGMLTLVLIQIALAVHNLIVT